MALADSGPRASLAATLTRTSAPIWWSVAAVVGLIVAGLLSLNHVLAESSRARVDSLVRAAHDFTTQALVGAAQVDLEAVLPLADDQQLRRAVARLTGHVDVEGYESSQVDWDQYLALQRVASVAGRSEIAVIDLVDARGMRVAASDPLAVGTTNPAFSGAAFARQLAVGEAAVSPPLVGSDGSPVIYLGVPLLDDVGGPFAHIVAAVRTAPVYDKVVDNGLFARTGHTYVVNRDGEFVTPTRFDDMLVDAGLLDPDAASAALRARAVEPGGEGSLVRAVREVVANRHGVDVVGFPGILGREVVGAWTWLPQLEVGVITEVAHAEVYRDLHALQRALALLGTGAIVLVAALGAMFERSRRSSERHAETLRDVAMHDSLTGLPNRHAFNFYLARALSRATRDGTKVALLFIDLDNFKRVNDSLGHDVGDELLVEVGRRLNGCVRGHDLVARGPDDTQRVDARPRGHDAPTVARLGGDEFVLVLTGLKEPTDAAAVAKRVLDALALDLDLHGRVLKISPSIGIAVGPADGDDVTSLVKSADMAMYAAKRAGRNRYEFFSGELAADAAELLDLETRLRHAIETELLEVYYQPLVEAETGRCTSVEALARWNDTELGFVSPSRFVPVAENSGLIRALGRLVMRRACMDAAGWARDDVGVAVNVASQQFADEQFVDVVAETLRESGLPASRLTLEITERVALSETRLTVRRLRALREMGVSISMDDFGTGYSSLSYLTQLPVDVIKIDASFVRGVPDDEAATALIASIVAMGLRLDKQLVAEGVETPSQRAFLAGEGVQKLQGWLFSKALPCAELEALLAEERGAEKSA